MKSEKEITSAFDLTEKALKKVGLVSKTRKHDLDAKVLAMLETHAGILSWVLDGEDQGCFEDFLRQVNKILELYIPEWN
jgi:hypothetical protein